MVFVNFFLTELISSHGWGRRLIKMARRNERPKDTTAVQRTPSMAGARPCSIITRTQAQQRSFMMSAIRDVPREKSTPTIQDARSGLIFLERGRYPCREWKAA